MIEAETRDGRIDIAALVGQLGEMGIASILIEGGSRGAGIGLSGRDRRQGLCLFYAPLVSGGDDGLPICRGPGAERIRDCIRLHRVRTQRFGDDVMIEGYVAEAGSLKPEA